MKEILELLGTAIASGVLVQLLNWRINRRKLKATTASEEYRTMEEIVERFNNQMQQMSDKIVTLLRRNQELESKINELQNPPKL